MSSRREVEPTTAGLNLDTSVPHESWTVKVVITGGAGFIGSACAVALMKRGDDVALIDSFNTLLYGRDLKERNLEWVSSHGRADLHELDIRDEERMRAVLERERPDVMLHLAAVAGVRPSIQQPALYHDINVRGTAILLEAARDVGVERFVLASSSSVYGGNEKTPFAEDDPVDQPVSPYAASKKALELIAHTHHHLYGGQMTCLRFFTVYGPRQRPEMAIHKFMALMDEGGEIPMFGDGTTGRDYTYIDDIVDGVLRAIDRPAGYRVYNLGGDDVVELSDLIAALGEVTGNEPRVKQLPMQPGDVLITNADLTRSRAELGYAPQTSIREGLAKMWAWYRG